MSKNIDSIIESNVNIVEFATCPYIYEIYSDLILKGFCGNIFSGIYGIHVSHLSSLIIFFVLMVNASLLYPHFKNKTICGGSKVHIEPADEVGPDDKGAGKKSPRQNQDQESELELGQVQRPPDSHSSDLDRNENFNERYNDVNSAAVLL